MKKFPNIFFYYFHWKHFSFIAKKTLYEKFCYVRINVWKLKDKKIKMKMRQEKQWSTMKKRSFISAIYDGFKPKNMSKLWKLFFGLLEKFFICWNFLWEILIWSEEKTKAQKSLIYYLQHWIYYMFVRAKKKKNNLIYRFSDKKKIQPYINQYIEKWVVSCVTFLHPCNFL